MKILFQLEQVSESNRKRETNHLAYLLSNEAGKGTRQLQEIQRTEGSGENLQPSCTACKKHIKMNVNYAQYPPRQLRHASISFSGTNNPYMNNP